MNGHFDVDLSNAGVEQVRDIGRVLKDHPITAVYSSDLQRTLKGAQIIAEYHSLKPIPFAELRELSFGHWEGLSIQELNTRFPGELDKRIQNTSTFQADGGETFRQLHDRVIPKYEEIIHRHPEETIVIMSHGGVNRTVLAHLLGFPADNLFRIAQEYAAVNILQYYESHVVVELMNGTPGQIR
jgi:broad specificity phosphatase PhoE